MPGLEVEHGAHPGSVKKGRRERVRARGQTHATVDCRQGRSEQARPSGTFLDYGFGGADGREGPRARAASQVHPDLTLWRRGEAGAHQ